jgi:hypothetical protein
MCLVRRVQRAGPGNLYGVDDRSEGRRITVLLTLLLLTVVLMTWAILGPTKRTRCYGQTPLTRVEIPCPPGGL